MTHDRTDLYVGIACAVVVLLYVLASIHNGAPL